MAASRAEVLSGYRALLRTMQTVRFCVAARGILSVWATDSTSPLDHSCENDVFGPQVFGKDAAALQSAHTQARQMIQDNVGLNEPTAISKRAW
jgi:hypothetical protein